MSHRYPVILTCALRASAALTAVTDFEERKRATLRSISAWRTLYPDWPLIVVDGSGTDIGALIDANDDRLASAIYLNVALDPAAVRRRGKGWAEGEIMRFALLSERGRTLCERGFFKCTGKLWCTNHRLFARMASGSFAFDAFFVDGKAFRVDTRYYFAKTEPYLTLLGRAHEQVDEPVGQDLERVFCQTLGARLAYREYLSPIVPMIHGLSGSMGNTYRPSIVHAAAKSVRNALKRRT